MSVTVSIRTREAIGAELYELELAYSGAIAADDDVATRIASDEFDAGRVELRNMPRESRNGRFAARTGTLNASTYITAARAQRAAYQSERGELRRRIADLKRERALWSDRTPLGMLEIARMLGYSDVAARQWKRRNVLPAPAGTVSGTPYWYRASILAWALEHGKTRAIVELDPTEYDSDYLEETA